MRIVTGRWREKLRCGCEGGEGEGVWVELERGGKKMKCVITLRGGWSDVRLFRNEVGNAPDDGTQGECDKAGEDAVFSG